jgi:hypothetical protein
MVSFFAFGFSMQPGRVLAESTKKETRKANGLAQEMQNIKNPGQAYKITLKTVGDRKEYKVGDTVQFEVSVDTDCHLYIMNVKEDGKAIGALFPNVWHKSSKVGGGKTYKIPNEKSNYRFKIAGPAGKEYVKAIATKEPILKEADTAIRKASENPSADSPGTPKQIVVEMKETLKKENPRDWAETTISFTVKDK